jgi:hypothetical protein
MIKICDMNIIFTNILVVVVLLLVLLLLIEHRQYNNNQSFFRIAFEITMCLERAQNVNAQHLVQ